MQQQVMQVAVVAVGPRVGDLPKLPRLNTICRTRADFGLAPTTERLLLRKIKTHQLVAEACVSRVTDRRAFWIAGRKPNFRGSGFVSQ